MVKLNLNSQSARDLILELWAAYPDTFKSTVREIAAKEQSPAGDDREQRIRALIQEDFDEYESVFRALA